MRGRLYGVGVGPGDPELMTMKAARVIPEDAGYYSLMIVKDKCSEGISKL